MKLVILSFLLGCYVYQAQAQSDEIWFYILAKDTLTIPFNHENKLAEYVGNDPILERIFDSKEIIQFKKTYVVNQLGSRETTYFVRTSSKTLLNDLLQEAPHIFVTGQLLLGSEKRIFEPNDYGLTSRIGENKGWQVELDYLDFLGLPKAWYYTTGRKEVMLGISDAYVDTTNTEFKDKFKVFRKSHDTKSHGSSVAAIAAAQGDNAYGLPGVCYDCSIGTTSYGDFRWFRQLMELSHDGIRVINCSWVVSHYYESAQDSINKMFDNGTIIVAGSGNSNWTKTKGKHLYYPASYDHVISVSTGMYKYENPKDNLLYEENGSPYVENIKGYVGRTAGFVDKDIDKAIKIYGVSIATLNEAVDLLAPSVGVVSFGNFLRTGELKYGTYQGTSISTPFVTGTIGLMFSLCPCLPVDEVESILKITSWNIDSIEVNKPYKGMYGAGMLQTGDAVELVYQLYNEKETAYIDHQDFSRWDFKLTAYSKEVVIKDQKFTDRATFNLKAKNKIVIEPNTVLSPGRNGKISLSVDPRLEKPCDLILRDPSIMEND